MPLWISVTSTEVFFEKRICEKACILLPFELKCTCGGNPFQLCLELFEAVRVLLHVILLNRIQKKPNRQGSCYYERNRSKIEKDEKGSGSEQSGAG